MRHNLRIGVVASLVAVAACEQSGSVTAPASSRDAPADALASKQGATGGQMLLNVLDIGSSSYAIGLASDDGTNLVAFTNYVSDQPNPAWAPDGKRIVFQSDALDAGHTSIYSANDDGTGVSRLTFAPVNGSDKIPTGFAKGIVFQRYDPADFGAAIFLLNGDGGVTQLTSGPMDTDPGPSPKGKSIAFIRDGDIYVLDLTTGGLTDVTNTPQCAEHNPAYSPSGKQLVFARFDCDNLPGGIFVIDDDGTHTTRLTTNGAEFMDWQPRWSPDGKRIGFSRLFASTATSPPSTTIYVMNADGTNLLELFTQGPEVSYGLSAWARY